MSMKNTLTDNPYSSFEQKKTGPLSKAHSKTRTHIKSGTLVISAGEDLALARWPMASRNWSQPVKN